jgi:hypothetical protein
MTQMIDAAGVRTAFQQPSSHSLAGYSLEICWIFTNDCDHHSRATCAALLEIARPLTAQIRFCAQFPGVRTGKDMRSF